MSLLTGVEVFIFVISVFVTLTTSERVDSALFKVSIEEAGYQLDYDRLESALAMDIQGHTFEKHSLPKMVKLTRVELDRLVMRFVACHREVEQLSDIVF